MPWRVCFAGYAPFATDATVGHGGVCKRRVNYLKPNEVQPFFCRVAETSSKVHPFVFDVSSPYKLPNRVGKQCLFCR